MRSQPSTLVLALVLTSCTPGSIEPGATGDATGDNPSNVGDSIRGDPTVGDPSATGDPRLGDPATGDPIVTAGDPRTGDPLWGTPHTLDPSHLGWKNQNCSVCKELPRPNHTASNPWECAECHGGNGACNPNGAYVARTHDPAVDDCVTCHSSKHGFAQPSHCVACHFADTAVVDCRTGPSDDGAPGGDPTPGDPRPGDAGLSLATLEDNCFDFPAQPFSPTNNCGGTSVNVVPGQRAYEFTLREIDGTSHTLSTLLARRPVLLVFGAYT